MHTVPEYFMVIALTHQKLKKHHRQHKSLGERLSQGTAQSWLGLLCKLTEWESSIHFCLNEVSDPLKGDTFTTQGIYTLLLQGSSSIWRGQIWLHVGTPNISSQFIPGDSFSDSALVIKLDAVLFCSGTEAQKKKKNKRVHCSVMRHMHR